MSGPSGAALLSTSKPAAPHLHESVDGRPSSFVAWWRSISPVDLAITLAFAFVLIVQISRHDMWRDEIHSWGLVLASPSLTDLFGNLRYTGHPGLWYLLLWPVSAFTGSPYTVQVVHAAIALLLIGAIGLFSPFSRLEKLLLLSSYFVLYEYTVISRNYGLGFLLALIYAEMRARRPERLYVNACLLGLLANTNMFAFLLSGAFALEYLVELWRRRGRALGAFVREALPPALVYAVLALGAAATMWPSRDISWRTTGEPLAQAFDPVRLVAMVAGNVESLLTIHPLYQWSSKAPSTIAAESAAALPVVAALFFFIFRNNRQLLIIPTLTAFGSIAADQLVYANSMRHWGVNFIAFVATFWIYRVGNRERSYAALALLAVSAIAGIAISIQQFPHTFSEGRHTAEWLRDNGYADAALVGTPDTLTMVVAQYLGKPIYQLDCSCTDTYLFYSKRRDAFDQKQIPERLATALHDVARPGRTIIFLITHPLSDKELADYRAHGVAATKLAAFDQAMTDENFFVYRVEPAPA